MKWLILEFKFDTSIKYTVTITVTYSMTMYTQLLLYVKVVSYFPHFLVYIYIFNIKIDFKMYAQ